MKVAFVLCPNMLLTSIDNPYELLFAASQIAKTQASFNKAAHLLTVAETISPIKLSSGLTIQANSLLEKEKFDIVYLPALWRNPLPIVRQSKKITRWLRWQYEQGAILSATGTGVCFLAETGLLDARSATTHWYYFEQFAKHYPKVDLKRQHFITQSGRIFCAASINALTDLTIHHAHRYYNKKVADRLSQQFSHEVRQPFETLNFNQDNSDYHSDETILQAQIWIQNHLDTSPLNIAQIAQSFGMSPRNFSRRFKSASKLTVNEYIQKQKHIAAKELLQNSNLSIKEVAYRVGFLDVSYFTKQFKAHASITPKQYRKTIRAKLFSK